MKKTYLAFALSTLVAGGMALTACQPFSTTNVQSVQTPAQVAAARIVKSPNDDRDYAAFVLPNGLQVVVVSDPTIETAAASLAVGVGSAHNPPEQQGLAHYLEHMLFLGTEKFPEPDGFMKFTQANGGMTNAFTAYEHTNYLFSINANQFDEALDRFSDYFKAPTFDPLYSDKERNAVHNEWSLQKAQDGWNIYRLQGITANPANPSAQFTIGNLDTLSDKPNSTLYDEMKRFYEQYYSANIMKLTLVGKQPIGELKALAEKHFAGIRNNSVELPSITVKGLTADQYAQAISYQPIRDMRVIFIDFPLVSNEHQWRVKPNEFVLNLLTSEEPGTLGEQLRSKGWVKTVTAYADSAAYGGDGFLRVQVELTESGLAHQDAIIASVFSYVDLIKAKGLNADYFRELKAMAEKNFANAPKASALDHAVSVSMAQFDYPVEHVLNANYVYDRYDEKAIRHVLTQLDERKARVWFINEKVKADTPIPFFDGTYSIAPISAEQQATWASLKSTTAYQLPPLNDLFSKKEAPIVDNQYLTPEVIVAKPGVEAFLVHPRYYREDKGRLSVELNRPALPESATTVALAGVMNELLNRQMMTLIDRAGRASLGINFSLNNTYSHTIALSGYTEKHDYLLKTVLHHLRNFSVTNDEFVATIQHQRQALSNRKKDHVFRQAWQQLERGVTRGHYSDEDVLAALNRLSVDDLRAYHASVVSTSLVRIFAAGNYTPQHVEIIAAHAHEVMPTSRLPESRVIPAYTLPSIKQTATYTGDVSLADAVVMNAWVSPNQSMNERAQLSVLNMILANALFAQLRTEEQLGYVVQSQTRVWNQQPAIAWVVQSSSTHMRGIQASMDKFRGQFSQRLASMSEAEIEQTKQSLVASLEEKPSDFYQDVGLYFPEFRVGHYDFDERDRFLAAVKTVSKNDLTTIYDNLFISGNAGQISIQLRGTNFTKAPFAAPN